MKFGVRSLALWCLLWWILCYPVFSLWNSACSLRTLECMRVWYLATHQGNYPGGMFALVDDNDSIALVPKPQISVNLKSALAGLALWFKAGCQNSRQAQSLAQSNLAPPAWMLQGRQMAPIQLDWTTMLAKKLLVGHTRSISSVILRMRYSRLTAYSILYEKICCLCKTKILCTSPCGIPRLLPTSFCGGHHDANPLLNAPK